MLRRRPLALFAAMILVCGFGGALLAQLESGDRGIPPLDSSGVLEVSGIHVDVSAATAEAARYAGWRIAQREGFRQLWAKANNAPTDQAPHVDDATLDGLVSSISVEREQIGPDRYVATLGVLFDRARAAGLVGMAGDNRRSSPMLLFPITITAGTPTSVETRNAWQRAWAGFRTSTSAIDYVRPSGMGVDPLLINAAQVERPGRRWWRNILDYYGAADVLVAEVQLHRLYPGGPAVAHFVGRHGPDGEIIGSFEVTDHDGGDLSVLMNTGVQKMDQLFTAALASGRLERDRSLDPPPAPPPPPDAEIETDEQPTATVVPTQAVTLLVTASDSAALGAAVAQVRGTPGVTDVTETSVAIGGTSTIVATYRGDIAGLRAALAGRGWTVDQIGDQLRLTRALAPAAPPAATPPPQASAPPPGQ